MGRPAGSLENARVLRIHPYLCRLGSFPREKPRVGQASADSPRARNDSADIERTRSRAATRSRDLEGVGRAALGLPP